MISRFAAAARLLVAVLGICLLGVSCAMPLLSGPNGSDSSDITTGIRIAISTGDSTARTALPTVPAFTKYAITFTANDGQTAVSEQTLTGATTLDIALEPGSWTITVKGYAKPILDEVVIAEGSAAVTVTTGVLSNIPISISAILTGANGSIPYSISIASGVAASAYSLELRNIVTKVVVENDVETISGTAISGNWSVAPGYYLATLSLTTSDSIATRQEVVHVYSNLVTPLRFTLAAADFMDLVKLSGSLDVKLDGSALTFGRYTIYAYTDPDNLGDTIIGTAEGSISAATSWTIRIPAPMKAFPVYFYVSYDNSPNTPSIKFCDYNVVGQATMVSTLDIDDINLSLSRVTLSGTFIPIVDGVGATFHFALIEAYSDAACMEESLDFVELETGTTWTMRVPSVGNARTIYFKARAQYESFTFNDVILATTCSVGSTAVNDVALTLPINTMTLRGTFAATMNGSAVNLANAPIFLSSTNQESGDTESYDGTIAVDGTWTVILPASTVETTYRGSFIAGKGEEILLSAKETITVPSGSGSVSGIALTAAYVSISGTATASIDNVAQSLSRCSIYASEDASLTAEYIGSGRIGKNGVAWTLYVPSASVPRDVYFTIGLGSSKIQSQKSTDRAVLKVMESEIPNADSLLRCLYPTATAVSNVAVSGISLDFDITTTKIGGFVSNHAGSVESIMIYKGSSMPTLRESMMDYIARFGTDGDIFSSRIDVNYLGTGYYFIVKISSGDETVYYANSTPIELTAAKAESLELDISKMTYLGKKILN